VIGASPRLVSSATLCNPGKLTPARGGVSSASREFTTVAGREVMRRRQLVGNIVSSSQHCSGYFCRAICKAASLPKDNAMDADWPPCEAVITVEYVPSSAEVRS
jgi:hypothetical protein